MKKIVFPLYSIIAIIVVFLFSCFMLVAYGLREENIHLYTGLSSFTIGDVYVSVSLVGGSLFLSAIGVFLHKNIQKKLLKVAIMFVVILVIFWLLFGVISSSTLFMPANYVEIVSDNGEHCIVIGEDAGLFSPYGGDIYEKLSIFTVKKIGEYEAGMDFYRPFSDGNYYVIWNQDNFELHYDFDGSGQDYASVTIEYAS